MTGLAMRVRERPTQRERRRGLFVVAKCRLINVEIIARTKNHHVAIVTM